MLHILIHYHLLHLLILIYMIHDIHVNSTKIEGGAIVVRDGKVTCLGSLSDCQSFLVADCQQYSLNGANGGIVTPGLIESGGQIGTMEAGIDLAGTTTTQGVDGSTSVYNMIDDVQVQAKYDIALTSTPVPPHNSFCVDI
jgi:imidazolonepropionase-like amidohydrolase